MSEGLLIFIFCLFALIMIAFTCYLGMSTCCGREILAHLGFTRYSHPSRHLHRGDDPDDMDGAHYEWVEMDTDLRSGTMTPAGLRASWERDAYTERDIWMRG
ncbi:hypothetical protein BC832DRAFT_388752 [Gaertneriomyces semiglobifer]|nr:hypothetical protein BC832DRAFT_388752 [Gaertneriomyces semiglobifer]